MGLWSKFKSRAGLGLPVEVSPEQAGRYRIEGVTIVNPGMERLERRSLSVSGGTLSSDDPALQGVETYAGCFALPGLVDMHVHLPPHNPLNLGVHASLSYLRYGVTTVRDAGDLDGTSVEAVKRLAAAGRIPTPRVLYCGPFVGARRKTFKNTVLIEDASEAPGIVEQVARLGASFVKLYDRLTTAHIEALQAAARERGLRTMGHVPAAYTVEASGIREVQHLFGVAMPEQLKPPSLLMRLADWRSVGDDRLKQVTEHCATHGIGNTPTLVSLSTMTHFRDYEAAGGSREARCSPALFHDIVWNPRFGGALGEVVDLPFLEEVVLPTLEKKRRLVKMLHEAGAELYLGTDVLQPFTSPGLALHQEMEQFAQAGIGLEEVWRLATRAAGDRLGVQGLGVIDVGHPADVLLFTKDPTVDLAAMDSLVAVIRDGRLFTRDALDEACNLALGYYRSPLVRVVAARAAQAAKEKALR